MSNAQGIQGDPHLQNLNWIDAEAYVKEEDRVQELCQDAQVPEQDDQWSVLAIHHQRGLLDLKGDFGKIREKWGEERNQDIGGRSIR